MLGEPCFLNSEMLKKIRACLGINKSSERHLSIPDYQSANVLFTIATFIKLPQPASRGKDVQKAAQYVFPSEISTDDSNSNLVEQNSEIMNIG